MTRISVQRRLCWIVALVVFARRESAPQAASPIEEQFKYGSIGAEDQEGIPYWIWQVLPRMFADKLPPGGYGALGMIWEPGHDTPIGFSKKTIWGVSRVAINCAFCHTESVRTSPGAAPMIVLAGASQQFDPQAYSKFLDATASDPRFNASEMMAEIGKMTTLSWFESAVVSPRPDSRREARAARARAEVHVDEQPAGVGEGADRSAEPVQVHDARAADRSDDRQLRHAAALEHEGAAQHGPALGRDEHRVPRGAAQFRARQRRDRQVARGGRDRSSWRLVRRGAAAEVPVPDRSDASRSRAARSLRPRVRRVMPPAARAPVR